jgi:hypothetical protein
VEQHGQVLRLRSCRSDGKALWACRYRVNGRCSKRPQVGGYATRVDAERALRRERLHKPFTRFHRCLYKQRRDPPQNLGEPRKNLPGSRDPLCRPPTFRRFGVWGCGVASNREAA